MGLFKKKSAPITFEVQIFKVGDIVFINGAIYKVEADVLQQLAVKPIAGEPK